VTYRTLETLRGIVSARLGFGSQGASLGSNAALINSFLQNAQYQLYWMQDWKKLTAYDDKSIGLDQYLVDYPDTANPERILKIAVNVGSGSDQWRELKEGIETEHYNTQALNGPPQRYERYAQIETWPKCDEVRSLRIWFVQSLGAFTANDDVATIDDEMILLHATAAGKSHYRHPDAPIWASQLDALLSRIRGTAFGKKRFHAPGKEDYDLIPRPVVV
jgi:hypothetical protein